MFEQFQRIRSLFEQARPLLEEHVTEEQVNELEQEIARRTASQQPVVMVYGVYNAGKSTLINALAGAELAAVSDVPQTDRVDEYQVGDVTILDTPGIDAPIAHEEITQAQLMRSDAVVFVLSSDGVLEEGQTYERIGQILRTGKPMLVVINNKSGYQPQAVAYIGLVERFRCNLRQAFADDPQVLDRLSQVEDFLVNARTALKGKLENKPVLVQHSQLPMLERAVSRLFARTDSMQIAKTLGGQLQALLEQAINHAEQGGQSEELRQLQRLINRIQESQKEVRERTLSFAVRGQSALKTNLNDLLQNAQESEAHSLLEQWQEEVESYFQQQLEHEIKQLDVEAARVVQLFLHQPGMIGLEDEARESTGFGLGGLLETMRASGLQLNPVKKLTKEGIVGLLQQAKKWFPDWFKGVGPVTMGKWADRALPMLGAAVTGAVVVHEYYQANKEEQRQLEAQQQRVDSIRLKVSSLVDNLYETLELMLEDVLRQLFDPMLSQLQQSLNALSQEVQGAEARVCALRSLHLKSGDF